jgi:hypothetical protein
MIRADVEPRAPALRPIGMSSKRPLAVGALAVAVLTGLTGLAGCANGSSVMSGSGGATGTAPGTSATAPTPTPAPSGTLVLPPVGTNPPNGTITVSGTLTRGAEPSCVILTTTTSGQYQLLDVKPVPREGSHVTVVGRLATQLMSHCMQGKPLRVLQLTVR